MKLSILIPSLYNRAGMLLSLLGSLEQQINDNGVAAEVELLVELDSGEKSIGEKRNTLLQKAKGDYLCFVDDDDSVSIDYIKLVMEGIKTNPDCCSLNGLITFNGGGGKLFRHSIKNKSYHEEDNIYLRFPNHLNTIKSDIAKLFKFPEINHSEDTAFAVQVFNSGLLKTEYNIPSIIYFYNYISNK